MNNARDVRIIYKDAAQGHPVPRRAYEARGPFSRVVPTVVDIDRDPDWFPPGATAQNKMAGIPLYECSGCHRIVLETDLDGHVCEGDG